MNEAAQSLGGSRVTLSRVLNGKAAISVSLALKLEAAGWGKADVWVGRQARYDLARERNRLGQWLKSPRSNLRLSGVSPPPRASSVEGEHAHGLDKLIGLVGIEAEPLAFGNDTSDPFNGLPLEHSVSPRRKQRRRHA